MSRNNTKPSILHPANNIAQTPTLYKQRKRPMLSIPTNYKFPALLLSRHPCHGRPWFYNTEWHNRDTKTSLASSTTPPVSTPVMEITKNSHNYTQVLTNVQEQYQTLQ